MLEDDAYFFKAIIYIYSVLHLKMRFLDAWVSSEHTRLTFACLFAVAYVLLDKCSSFHFFNGV